MVVGWVACRVWPHSTASDWTVRIMSMQEGRKKRENMLRFKELNYDKLSFFFGGVSRVGRGSPSVRVSERQQVARQRAADSRFPFSMLIKSVCACVCATTSV